MSEKTLTISVEEVGLLVMMLEPSQVKRYVEYKTSDNVSRVTNIETSASLNGTVSRTITYEVEDDSKTAIVDFDVHVPKAVKQSRGSWSRFVADLFSCDETDAIVDQVWIGDGTHNQDEYSSIEGTVELEYEEL